MEKIFILQDDDNYLVEQLYEGDTWVLRKTVKETMSKHRRATFANECTGMERFRELAVAHPEWGLMVPRIVAKGEGSVTREFINGDELVNQRTTVEDGRLRLERLAGVLAAIDSVVPPPTDLREEDSAPYTNIRRRFDVWSEVPLKEGILDREAYEAANQLIQEYQPFLEPRHAHGDMSPFKHVFVMSDDRLAFIDFEHYSTMKPRYYDVAYCYSRLRMQAKDRRLSGVFLEDFIREADKTQHQKEQLLAIMTQRAIGMHFDALNDYKQGDDYRERAQEFLGLCLQRDIDAL